jgi:hypothetical protein
MRLPWRRDKELPPLDPFRPDPYRAEPTPDVPSKWRVVDADEKAVAANLPEDEANNQRLQLNREWRDRAWKGFDRYSDPRNRERGEPEERPTDSADWVESVARGWSCSGCGSCVVLAGCVGLVAFTAALAVAFRERIWNPHAQRRDR